MSDEPQPRAKRDTDAGESVPPHEAPTPSSVEELFHEALALPPGEREAYLEKACGEDRGRFEEVITLLRASMEAEEGMLATREALGAGAEAALEVLETASQEQGERAGDWIGPYKLLEPIGEGGFGTVWEAEQHEPLRRHVALKIVKLGMDTRNVVARFELERQAVAMMDHPGIAKVFDAGATPSGRPYFVMERVRGRRITEYCDKENLSTTARLKLFIEVCSAVQHAHQKGIIHRDLKPSNILVAEAAATTGGDRSTSRVPLPKIIDFGVAKATQQDGITEAASTVFTQAGQFVGTPLYMAPEQADPSAQDIDTRCDVYALGVLLYELLVGKPPFDPQALIDAGYEEIRRVIREEDPPKPSTKLSKTRASSSDTNPRAQPITSGALRGDLDCIVMKAMEKPRDRRYATANDLAEDIRHHLENEPVRARPPSHLYRLGRMVRRHRGGFVAAAVVGATLLAGAGGVIWRSFEARAEAARASVALESLDANAPALAADARQDASKGHFKKALEKLDLALQLRPESPDYFLTKGDLFQSQLKFGEAATAYRAVLKADPDHARAAKHAALSERLVKEADRGAFSGETASALLDAMIAEQRAPWEMLEVSRLAGRENLVTRELLIERLRRLSLRSDLAWENRVVVDDSGQVSSDLSNTGLTDLEPLAGLSIGTLNLSDNPLADLSGVENVALRSLDLSGTKVEDLSRLTNIKLERLNLQSCTEIQSFAPLQELPRLTHLRLPDGLARVSDEVVKTLEGLRGHATLRWIGSTPAESEWAFEPATKFWERYDLAIRTENAVQPLLFGNIGEFKERLQDWTWKVHIPLKPEYKVIEKLEGLPISNFLVSVDAKTDLSPLQSMPLRALKLYSNEGFDLQALVGISPDSLSFRSWHQVDGITLDLQPLASIPTLTEILLPANANLIHLESLKELPRLELLSADRIYLGHGDWRPAQRADDIWNGEPLNLRRDEALARSGRFREAEANLRLQIKRGILRLGQRVGTVAAASGDQAHYREVCAELLETHRRGQLSSPMAVARTALLRPDSGVSFEIIEEILELDGARMRESTALAPYWYLYESLLRYRRGLFEQVAESTAKTQSDRYPVFTVTAEVVQAMAYSRLGRHTEARERLVEARAEISKHWPEGSDGGSWVRWLIAHLLLQEAEALMRTAVEENP